MPFMSYSIGVTVKNGQAEIDPASTSLPPDGAYVINGHVPSKGTWQAENIQVTRYQPDSASIVIQAAGTHYIAGTPEQRAKAGYDRYFDDCGGRSVHGEQLPLWEDQHEDVRAHWTAAFDE